MNKIIIGLALITVSHLVSADSSMFKRYTGDNPVVICFSSQAYDLAGSGELTGMILNGHCDLLNDFKWRLVDGNFASADKFRIIRSDGAAFYGYGSYSLIQDYQREANNKIKRDKRIRDRQIKDRKKREQQVIDMDNERKRKEKIERECTKDYTYNGDSVANLSIFLLIFLVAFLLTLTSMISDRSSKSYIFKAPFAIIFGLLTIVSSFELISFIKNDGDVVSYYCKELIEGQSKPDIKKESKTESKKEYKYYQGSFIKNSKWEIDRFSRNGGNVYYISSMNNKNTAFALYCGRNDKGVFNVSYSVVNYAKSFETLQDYKVKSHNENISEFIDGELTANTKKSAKRNIYMGMDESIYKNKISSFVEALASNEHISIEFENKNGEQIVASYMIDNLTRIKDKFQRKCGVK